MKSLPEKQQGRLVLQSTATSLEASPIVDKVEVLEDVKAETEIAFDFPVSTGCPC